MIGDLGHLAWPFLGLVAALLMGILAFEAGNVEVDIQSTSYVPALQPLALVPAPAASAGMTSSQRLDATLARPLFSANRRPPAEAAVSIVGSLTPLPRLTGVVVSSAGAVAIFASFDDGKPVVVGEGGTVGAAIIETIAPGKVTLRGPDGAIVLHPVFDGKALEMTALNPREPQMPGYGRRQGGPHAAFWKAVATATQPSNSR